MEKLISGKVRDVYKINEKELVIVTTDRISAFDVILPSLIPNKGRVLNQIALFWFDYTKDLVSNHLLEGELPEEFGGEEYRGRTIKAKRLKMLPFEFVVRGYMFGHMWEAYQQGEDFCGYCFADKYELAQKLFKPILTPSTKADIGDEYITMQTVADVLGDNMAEKIERICFDLYERCYKYAYERGIIIADTKLEFGYDEYGKLYLADEVFTPDSSRFWSLKDYQIGTSPKSFDKQFVRDWLIKQGKDGVKPAPELPAEIIEKTAALYAECLEIICGEKTPA